MNIISRPLPAWCLVLALFFGIGLALLLNGIASSDISEVRRSGPPIGTVLWWGLAVLALAGAIAAGLTFLPRIPGIALSVPAERQPQRDMLAQTGTLLSLELGKVLSLIRARIGLDESYANSLAAAQARLANLPPPEQVRVIVSLLVAENHRISQEAQNSAKQLEASRLQIEALRARLEKAHEVGLQDPLTLVGNRRCFDIALSEAIKSANASQTALSIVMGDIDSFKKVNDDFGHQVGDEVLKFFTQLMITSVRGGDTVTRFGGEEFAIILPECRDVEAGAIAERIRSKLGAKSLTIRKSETDIGIVTASFGIAQLRPGESMDGLVNRADGGLYEAKKSGRNRVVVV